VDNLGASQSSFLCKSAAASAEPTKTTPGQSTTTKLQANQYLSLTNCWGFPMNERDSVETQFQLGAKSNKNEVRDGLAKQEFEPDTIHN